MWLVVKTSDVVAETGTVAVVEREAFFRMSPTGPGMVWYEIEGILDGEVV